MKPGDRLRVHTFVALHLTDPDTLQEAGRLPHGSVVTFERDAADPDMGIIVRTSKGRIVLVPRSAMKPV